MRIARVLVQDRIRYAVAHDGQWAIIEDPFAAQYTYTGQAIPLSGAHLFAPTEPEVLVGIGHNVTRKDSMPPIQAWHKSRRSIAGPGDAIELTRGAGTVNVEGELAVVIGKFASNLTVENAFDAVLGYTVANDVTNFDQVSLDNKAFQSKGGVNYTPLGPWIETELDDPENVAIDVRVNGEVRAQSGSFNLPSSVAQTLVYVTSWLTLGPGDVVMTGSPNTFTAVHPGDRVDITLAGIGTLSNSVI